LTPIDLEFNKIVLKTAQLDRQGYYRYEHNIESNSLTHLEYEELIYRLRTRYDKVISKGIKLYNNYYVVVVTW
jgi:hypothetical protein